MQLVDDTSIPVTARTLRSDEVLDGFLTMSVAGGVRCVEEYLEAGRFRLDVPKRAAQGQVLDLNK